MKIMLPKIGDEERSLEDRTSIVIVGANGVIDLKK